MRNFYRVILVASSGQRTIDRSTEGFEDVSDAFRRRVA